MKSKKWTSNFSFNVQLLWKLKTHLARLWKSQKLPQKLPRRPWLHVWFKNKTNFQNEFEDFDFCFLKLVLNQNRVKILFCCFSFLNALIRFEKWKIIQSNPGMESIIQKSNFLKNENCIFSFFKFWNMDLNFYFFQLKLKRNLNL